MRSDAQQFSDQVRLDGINPYIEVPEAIIWGWGERGSIPVLVRVVMLDDILPDGSVPEPDVAAGDALRLRAIARLTEDGWFRTSLVPRRNSPPRLYLDKWMREAAGASTGDQVLIVLQRDTRSREIEVPTALREALEADPDAMAAWDALAPSRRREILTYLAFLTSHAALERNVEKTIQSLKS